MKKDLSLKKKKNASSFESINLRERKKSPVFPHNVELADFICMFCELKIQLVNLTKEKEIISIN